MNETESRALAVCLLEVSSSLAKLAQALGASPHLVVDAPPPLYGPATVDLPWRERTLRQALILDDIQAAGGNVEQSLWQDIAAKYGYTGRGTAGFFRSNGQGMLELRKNGRVYLTKRGRERLAANKQRVAQARAAEAEHAVGTSGQAEPVGA